jgi:hypothetical protein
LGSRISQKLDYAISYAVGNDLDMLGDFLWADGQKYAPLRVFKGNGEKRSVEHIPPEEIAFAIVECVQNAMSISEDDLVRETARLFGLRATKQVAGEVRSVIQSLFRINKLSRKNKKISL